MLSSRKEAGDADRQIEVAVRSEQMIARLLEKARLRSRRGATSDSEQAVAELERQHKLAVELLDRLRSTSRV